MVFCWFLILNACDPSFRRPAGVDALCSGETGRGRRGRGAESQRVWVKSDLSAFLGDEKATLSLLQRLQLGVLGVGFDRCRFGSEGLPRLHCSKSLWFEQNKWQKTEDRLTTDGIGMIGMEPEGPKCRRV